MPTSNFKTLYLLEYNNYYNRIVRKESSLTDYQTFLLGQPITGVNFIPNDGVDTQQVINWSEPYEPDYLLVVNSDNQIESRWFIIESVRTREGQYMLTLHRDLVVDYYDYLINAPCFIEKATVGQNDVAIFNSENMKFNQILTDSIPLKDKSECPWLVGYVARNASTFNNLQIDYEADIVPNYSIDSQSELPFYKYLGKTYTNFGDIAIDVIFTNSQESNALTINSFNKYGDAPLPAKSKAQTATAGFGWLTTTTSDENKEGYFDQMLSYINKTAAHTTNMQVGTTGGLIDLPKYEYANAYFTSYIRNAVTESEWNIIQSQVEAYTGNSAVNEINQYVGQVVKMKSDGTYWRVVLQTESASSEYSGPISGDSIPNVDELIRGAYNRAMPQYRAAYSNLAAGMSQSVAVESPTANNIMCTIRVSASTTAKLVLERIDDTKIQAKLTTTEAHVHLTDAPYDMFCMPYSDDLEIIAKSAEGSKLTIKSSKALALATMNAIARQGVGANKVHDIQLLPYCPLQQYITPDGKIDFTQPTSLTESQSRYDFITDISGVARMGVFIYCDSSQGEFDIPYNIPVTDYKIQAECDIYRLCSPNYSSIFEFNAAYNRGVEKFNVDFSYKPYSPYIHLNPNFKKNGLYGLDRNEPRGLICGGDFSITLISDPWETYQLQNKNFELSFQRQIDNMQVNNAVQREREMWSVMAGTVGAATSGATAGLMAAGPAGLVAGIGTGLISAGAGARDIQLNEKLRTEAIDYSKDMFGYNLQNIQALPHTIAKVTAFNPNNKIFPVLEYYTCTEIEKQALADKIKYNGMTIMRVGYIGEFLQEDRTYIKGQLIRLEGISADFHLTNAIASEIYKGVFI